MFNMFLPNRQLSVFQPQSSLMDLMDVPEPRATSDPWGARAGAGGGGGSADPWHAHGKSNDGHTLSPSGRRRT